MQAAAMASLWRVSAPHPGFRRHRVLRGSCGRRWPARHACAEATGRRCPALRGNISTPSEVPCRLRKCGASPRVCVRLFASFVPVDRRQATGVSLESGHRPCIGRRTGLKRVIRGSPYAGFSKKSPSNARLSSASSYQTRSEYHPWFASTSSRSSTPSPQCPPSTL